MHQKEDITNKKNENQINPSQFITIRPDAALKSQLISVKEQGFHDSNEMIEIHNLLAETK